MRWLPILLLACACDRERPVAPAPKPPRASNPVPLRVTVGEPVAITEGEDVRVLSFPNPVAPDERFMDSACLLYRNREFKTAQVLCPGGAPDVHEFHHGDD